MRATLLLFTLIVTPALRAEKSAPLSFALVDSPGNHLLGLGPLQHPDQMEWAICPHQTLRVKYLREQKARKNNGRHSVANFDKLAGYLYEGEQQITQLKANTVEGTTCLLLSGAEYQSRVKLTLWPNDSHACDANARERIAKLKDSKVRLCYELAEIECKVISKCRKTVTIQQFRLMLVEFESRGKNMLAALYMVGKDKIVSRDYPARADETSSWRVDDGGKFAPDGFEVIFALKSEQGLELALLWHGAEGTRISLLREDGGMFKAVLESYRYLAPE